MGKFPRNRSGQISLESPLGKFYFPRDRIGQKFVFVILLLYLHNKQHKIN